MSELLSTRLSTILQDITETRALLQSTCQVSEQISLFTAPTPPASLPKPVRAEKVATRVQEIKRQLRSLQDEMNQYYSRAGGTVSVHAPSDAANEVMPILASMEQEVLQVILLNTRNRILQIVQVYQGSVNTSQVRIAEIFREAIRLNAVNIIVVHNHPSGDPTPSPEDVAITRAIVQAGKLLDINLLDHLVIGSDKWVSLKERGLGFS